MTLKCTSLTKLVRDEKKIKSSIFMFARNSNRRKHISL